MYRLEAGQGGGKGGGVARTTKQRQPGQQRQVPPHQHQHLHLPQQQQQQRQREQREQRQQRQQTAGTSPDDAYMTHREVVQRLHERMVALFRRAQAAAGRGSGAEAGIISERAYAIRRMKIHYTIQCSDFIYTEK